MNQQDVPVTPSASLADRLVRMLVFLVLALVIVTPPFAPTNELDASWRMALGRFFLDGLQFGKDVVFTYGPLGFLMGKTYCGLQYHSLILWQVLQALVFGALIYRQGMRLQGYPRLVYFAYFLLLGATYEDALHQQVIALVGFELLRGQEDGRRFLPAALGALLGLLALIKFTDLMLGGIFVALAVGLHLWRRRNRAALWLAAWYAGTYLLGWVLCRQNPLNLPAYLYNSWEISQGYQETMGIPTPADALQVGLIAAGLGLAYLALFFTGLTDRARATATALGFGAYAFLNWKHGFVRADGHMIGFFYALLLPATAYPALLDDDPRARRVVRPLLAVLVGLCLLGVGTALPGILRGILSGFQERVYTSASLFLHPDTARERYRRLLSEEQVSYAMPKTREVVGRETLDVIGYEQAIAIYNGFNYRPRPVLQSYSAYRPHLSRLNAKFYASRRAPEFVLLKLHTIDRRLVTMDDSEVLHLILHRYEYVHTEKDYQLWRRKAGPFDAGALAPRPLRTSTIAVGQPCLTAEFGATPLWATIDLQPSLLGRLTGFLYKLPIVTLRLTDTHGNRFDYRMPLPMGRTGFIVSPMVNDLPSLMQFAGAKPDRFLGSLTVLVDPPDRAYFSDFYTATISALPPSTAGIEFYAQQDKARFHLLGLVPLDYQAQTPISDGEIEGKPVMVFHAPSSLTLSVRKGAVEFTGYFGFLPGAYTNPGETDGATFYITWVHGSDETILLERTLDPVHNLTDRGLQQFRVRLPTYDGGVLRLRTHPGPRNNFSWDWTAWGGLTLH